MLETTRYVRKPFYVDSVQVTAENIEEVAAWAGGTIHVDSNNKKFIRVRVQNPTHERQSKAYTQDWVLYTSTGYKVYTPKAFTNSFEKAEEAKPIVVNQTIVTAPAPESDPMKDELDKIAASA